MTGTSTGQAPKRSRLRLSLLALSALLPLAAALPSSPASAAVLPAAPSVTSPRPAGIAGTWNMTFADEFNDTTLDPTTWQPGWYGSRVTAPVNSSEQQCYSPRQATESGGALHLSLVARRLTCGGIARSYASGLVSSNPDALGAGKGFQFTYGVAEFRVFVPADATGKCANWPAVWSNGQTWPTDGEIDTFECLSSAPSWHLHSDSTGGAADEPGGYPVGNYTGWHTFASDWEPGSVTFYYDGQKVGSHPFTVPSPHYLVLDNAAAGGSTPVPADMQVDYVRVFQH